MRVPVHEVQHRPWVCPVEFHDLLYKVKNLLFIIYCLPIYYSRRAYNLHAPPAKLQLWKIYYSHSVWLIFSTCLPPHFEQIIVSASLFFCHFEYLEKHTFSNFFKLLLDCSPNSHHIWHVRSTACLCVQLRRTFFISQKMTGHLQDNLQD